MNHGRFSGVGFLVALTPDSSKPVVTDEGGPGNWPHVLNQRLVDKWIYPPSVFAL